MNYWIEFLKYLNNYNARPYTKELYELLLKLLNEDKILIPISDIHLLESYKSKDRYKYESILQLMELFSKNVCFVGTQRRWEIELIFCLRVVLGIRNANELLQNELWTKPIFLKEVMIPSLDNIPFKSMNEKIEAQKSYINFVWNKNLSDIFTSINEEWMSELDPSDYEEHVTQLLIKGREDNKNDFRDFTELLEKELYGVLELANPDIENLLTEYFKGYSVGTSVIGDRFFALEKSERSIRLIYLIVQCIVSSKQYDVLPALSIGSCLHSIKRWKKESHYKNSDTFDIMHAKIALPYCDYFFTERNLKGLIQESYLGLDEIFNCSVIHNIEEALTSLSALN
ncbi:hypothetical protein JWG44_00030 [Leptospira sp. 201903071]|nr:hypothetical protein [Leptospira ainazelensis]